MKPLHDSLTRIPEEKRYLSATGLEGLIESYGSFAGIDTLELLINKQIAELEERQRKLTMRPRRDEIENSRIGARLQELKAAQGGGKNGLFLFCRLEAQREKIAALETIDSEIAKLCRRRSKGYVDMADFIYQEYQAEIEL